MPLRKRNGEYIIDWLEEIGFSWTSSSNDYCNENPSQIRRRFKLYDQHSMSLGISLWNGTSHLVPCDDWNFPEDDEISWYRKDANGKEIVIVIMIRVEKSLDTGEIEKRYSVRGGDEFSILPTKYTSFKMSSHQLGEVRKLLDEIRVALDNAS